MMSKIYRVYVKILLPFVDNINKIEELGNLSMIITSED